MDELDVENTIKLNRALFEAAYPDYLVRKVLK